MSLLTQLLTTSYLIATVPEWTMAIPRSHYRSEISQGAVTFTICLMLDSREVGSHSSYRTKTVLGKGSLYFAHTTDSARFVLIYALDSGVSVERCWEKLTSGYYM